MQFVGEEIINGSQSGTGEWNICRESVRESGDHVDVYGTMFRFSSSKSRDSTRFNSLCSLLNRNLLSL